MGVGEADREVDTLAVAAPDVMPSHGLSLPAEIAFLERFAIDRAVLVEATERAVAAGVTADRALLAAGCLSAERFYRHLADHLGVAFLHHPLPVATGVSIDAVMQAEIVPLAPNASGFLFVLAPRGETLARLLDRVGPPHRGDHLSHVAITTPRRLAALVRRRHRNAIVRAASHGLPDWNPRLSALAGWSLAQRAVLFLAGFAIAVGIGISPPSTFAALCLGLSILFFGLVAMRLLATACSPAPTPPTGPRLPDDQLPIYTVVVPLFREHRVVPDIVRALSRLD